MRKLRSFLVVAFALIVMVPGAAAQGGATPAPDADVPDESAVGNTVVYVDESGNGIANITVVELARDWQGHDNQPPREGFEYIAVTVTVESTIARGTLDVRDHYVILQDADGFVWTRAGVRVPEDAATIPLAAPQQLANGESVTFLVVFQVLPGQALDHLFWAPAGGRMLTLAAVRGL